MTVLNVPSGFDMKSPLTFELLSPLSKTTWPTSFIDTREDRLLKLNPSAVGTSARKRCWNVPSFAPMYRPCWNVPSSSGTIATRPDVFTD